MKKKALQTLEKRHYIHLKKAQPFKSTHSIFITIGSIKKNASARLVLIIDGAQAVLATLQDATRAQLVQHAP